MGPVREADAMSRECTVCIHPQRADIGRGARGTGRLDSGHSGTYGVSRTSLHRHRSEHLPAHLASAVPADEVADAGDLLAQVHGLRIKSLELLGKAEGAGDYRAALAGVREARACVELLLEVEGELTAVP